MSGSDWPGIQKGRYQLGPCFSHKQPELRTPGCGVVFLPPSRGSCSARSCPWWILATCNPVFVGGKKPRPDAPTQRRNTSVHSWGSRTLFALLASFDTGTLGTLTEIHLIQSLCFPSSCLSHHPEVHFLWENKNGSGRTEPLEKLPRV